MNSPAANPHAKMGKWMFIGAWLLVLGLLTLFFDDELARQHNPNQSLTVTETREVVLQRNRAGHYVATGRINGVAVEFLVDTGASDVAIPSNVARQLGLRPQAQIIYQTANGAVQGFRTTLDSVELGPIKVSAVIGGINPGMQDNQVLLGMSFLKHLELIQKGDTLTLKHAGP